MKMTMSRGYLGANLEILETLGVPKHFALDVLDMNLSDLDSPAKRVCLDRFLSCLNEAPKYTSDPYIALRLGHKFRVGSFGNTGSLYGYCGNMAQVIQMNKLYQKVAIDAGRAEHIIGVNGEHYMCFRPHYEDLVRYRFITDMIMASYVTTYKWLLWGAGDDIIKTHIPYVQRHEASTYVDILETEIDRVSDMIAIQLSESAMSQTLTTHNPEGLAHARVVLGKLLDEQNTNFAFERAINAAIRGAIETGRVSSHLIAERMGLSWSDLRNQLALTDEGIRPRLDRVRKSLFIEKYEAGHSLSQIAIDLAYNDQAAMNRAFRRWFNKTPTQWKLEHPLPA